MAVNKLRATLGVLESEGAIIRADGINPATGHPLHCMDDPQPEGHMASYIERRKFLATLGGAAAWPLAARAQQREQMRRIGVLMPNAADDPEYQACSRS
jgi:hypothetical protein